MAQERSVSSSPVAKAEDLASSDQTPLAVLPQPPPVASTTIGMKLMPCAEHCALVSLYEHLKSSYLVSTDSGSRMESWSTSCRSPLVTAKSHAAGGPDRHLGMYTSAGRRALGSASCASSFRPFSYAEPEKGRWGRSPGFSNSGWRLAEAAAKYTMLRRRLCRSVRSPPHRNTLWHDRQNGPELCRNTGRTRPHLRRRFAACGAA